VSAPLSFVQLNHQNFQDILKESERAVLRVAEHYIHRGFEVEVPELKVAPTVDVRKQYSDQGDLFVRGPDGLRRRIEVKGLGYQWTCKEDWPHHRYAVCSKKSWDRADPKPHQYVSLALDFTHIGVVMFDTAPDWTVGRMHDKRYVNDSHHERYFCPLERVWFGVLPDILDVEF